MEGLAAACAPAASAPAITRFSTGDLLPLDPEPANAPSEVRAAVKDCLAAARLVRTEVASGERLSAARAAVGLVRAYDRVLDNIRLVPLSGQEQQSLRDQLAPVTELLRKYRLR